MHTGLKGSKNLIATLCTGEAENTERDESNCYLEELPFPVSPQTSAHPGCSGERSKVCRRQSSRVPVLPEKVDPFCMCLSPEDTRELSPDSCAQQVPSLSHIIVEGRDMMYKLVYDTVEEMALADALSHLPCTQCG